MRLPLVIERRAAANRWSSCHPAPKAALACALLVTASWHPSFAMALLAGGGSLWILRHVGVTWTELADTTSVPAGLLLLGALPLSVHVTPAAAPWLHPSAAGAREALVLVARGLCATLATLVLACSTPVGDLVWLLVRLRVPRPLVEMVLAMHRFLFALAHTSVALHGAQRARLGFIGWSGCIRSSGLIAGALFGHAIDRALRLDRGLASRGGLPPAGEYAPMAAGLRLALAAAAGVAAVSVVRAWP